MTIPFSECFFIQNDGTNPDDAGDVEVAETQAQPFCNSVCSEKQIPKCLGQERDGGCLVQKKHRVQDKMTKDRAANPTSSFLLERR